MDTHQIVQIQLDAIQNQAAVQNQLNAMRAELDAERTRRMALETAHASLRSEFDQLKNLSGLWKLTGR